MTWDHAARTGGETAARRAHAVSLVRDRVPRERLIKAREDAFETRMNAAAEKAVNLAVENKRLLPAQKESCCIPS